VLRHYHGHYHENWIHIVKCLYFCYNFILVTLLVKVPSVLFQQLKCNILCLKMWNKNHYFIFHILHLINVHITLYPYFPKVDWKTTKSLL
jgi:hypothetical protein